ncbi:unnamed protein product [Larinioides sclopetarius]|uniref:Uncharacterized protein n=1 Tax=Larinioides sclopetarius TaxID=280406 RepID=A0AAV2BTZ7_9ARAC
MEKDLSFIPCFRHVYPLVYANAESVKVILLEGIALESSIGCKLPLKAADSFDKSYPVISERMRLLAKIKYWVQVAFEIR